MKKKKKKKKKKKHNWSRSDCILQELATASICSFPQISFSASYGHPSAPIPVKELHEEEKYIYLVQNTLGY
jgi:hypothetical protein